MGEGGDSYKRRAYAGFAGLTHLSVPREQRPVVSIVNLWRKLRYNNAVKVLVLTVRTNRNPGDMRSEVDLRRFFSCEGSGGEVGYSPRAELTAYLHRSLYTEDEILRIENFAEELANGTVYTMGVPL